MSACIFVSFRNFNFGYIFFMTDMKKRYSKQTRTYIQEQLDDAVKAVKSKTLTVSQAAREFGVPRKTVDDHAKKEFKAKPGPMSELLAEEEDALVSYCEYLATRGFPMTRAMMRTFVSAIVRKSGRETKFNLSNGPSDKWFRNFFQRHPSLTEREAETQDRSRARMSNPKVMKQYFDLLHATINRLGVSASQIYNCDETGWSGKEKSRQRVIGIKGQHSYQQAVMASGHITAHITICADGKVLPTFVIFEKSFPHIAYKDGVPGDWLFGYSDSGYMDSSLFLNWFQKVFIPNCGPKRPVLLIMDNHDSHTTLDVIECAMENQIELLGLPPHTTHLLQPLDVSINGPLKAKFSSTAVNLGHLNKNQTVNKAKFPVVLSYAIDEFCSPARVKDAFRKTGICPYNPDAIDQSQLSKSHQIASYSDKGLAMNITENTETLTGNPTKPECASETSSTEFSSSAKVTGLCSTCGTYLGENPLVTEGLIPAHLSGIFLPVPSKPVTTRRKLVLEARVITSEEHVAKLREKQEEDKRKKELVLKRKLEREEKKRLKEESEKHKTGKKRKQNMEDTSTAVTDGSSMDTTTIIENSYICKICEATDGVNNDNDIVWIGCDGCEDWFHPDCVGFSDATDLDSITFFCSSCIEEE